MLITAASDRQKKRNKIKYWCHTQAQFYAKWHFILLLSDFYRFFTVCILSRGYTRRNKQRQLYQTGAGSLSDDSNVYKIELVVMLTPKERQK